MEEIHLVLSPVRGLCTLLETSSAPSLSLPIPHTSQLIQVLTELYGQLMLPSCRAVCAKVRNSVSKRMTAAMVDPASMVAMMLDPRARQRKVMNYNKRCAISWDAAVSVRHVERRAESSGRAGVEAGEVFVGVGGGERYQ